jgi:DNA primase large subunit
MSTTVAQMTKEELQEMLEAAIEQKLFEMLGDPDEELELRDTVRKRLLRQQRAVAEGERGQAFENVVQQIGLG